MASAVLGGAGRCWRCWAVLGGAGWCSECKCCAAAGGGGGVASLRSLRPLQIHSGDVNVHGDTSPNCMPDCQLVLRTDAGKHL